MNQFGPHEKRPSARPDAGEACMPETLFTNDVHHDLKHTRKSRDQEGVQRWSGRPLLGNYSGQFGASVCRELRRMRSPSGILSRSPLASTLCPLWESAINALAYWRGKLFVPNG